MRRGSRRVLLDVLGANNGGAQIVPKETQEIPQDELEKNELVLIWELRPSYQSDLPNLVIVPNGELHDFLAWFSTFAPSFLPFTAFVRVLEARTAKAFWKQIGVQPLAQESQGCCAGLILGEVISQAPYRIDATSLSPLTCTSTLSYCMTRALALRALDENTDRIVEKWSLARHLLGQPDRKLRAETIRDVWLILGDVLNGDLFALKNTHLKVPSGAIVRALLDLKIGQKISIETWRDLVANNRDLVNTPERMQGSKEERVTRFEAAVLSLAHNPTVNPGIASFLCGYLASLIELGSLLYAKLVSPLLDRFPTAMLWYGLCAGFEKENELLGQFDGVARRVLRDIVSPDSLLSRPQCDIAIDELEVFLTGDKPFRDFHRSSPKHASIELLPRIHTVLNWTDSSSRGQQELADSTRYRDNEFLAKQLSQAIQSLNQIHNTLVNSRDKALPSGVTRDRGKRRR